MCGICGVLREDNHNSLKMVKEMNTEMRHRGPDNSGYYQDHNVVLGHTRLSIIDLSSNGHQPMFSSDNNLVTVFNGEIYNYSELKQELRDYPFKSNTDTEIILALYSKYKERCVDHLKGMFAFAIWDRNDKTLFAARDHLGIKPFYYYWNNDTFIFSSELRPIIKSGIKHFSINHNALAQYIAYATVIQPDTIVKDIYMLPSGSSLIYRNGKLQLNTYWSPGNHNVEVPDNYETVLKDIRNYYVRSVTSQTRSDVPLGIFLSGGIDSISITGVLSKTLDKQVKTFTVAFREKQYDESDYAKYISQKYNTDHTELLLESSKMLDWVFPALDAIDHPSGDGFNSYIVSRVTKNAGITVALSGLGGDEIFNGYYYSQWIYDLFNKTKILKYPLMARKLATTLNHIYKKSYSSAKLTKMVSHKNPKVFDLYSDAVRYTDSKHYKTLIKKNGYWDYDLNNILRNFCRFNESDEYLLGKISKCDIFFYLKNVLLRDADQMSMANSLEVRVPFLDFELIDYVLNIHDKFKVNNGFVGKKIFLDSLSDFLPEDLGKRKKTGFNLPMTYWIKNELFTFSQQKIKNLIERLPDFRDLIEESWNAFLGSAMYSSNDMHLTHIWSLVTLEYWLEENGLDVDGQ